MTDKRWRRLDWSLDLVLVEVVLGTLLLAAVLAAVVSWFAAAILFVLIIGYGM